jgi:hypothetical protein
MNVLFDPLEEEYVEKFFNDFFHRDSIFFEIISNNIAIGFYGIKTITDKVCEISVYFHDKFRDKITKAVALKCLNFPFLLGFDKIVIRTELQKMKRFLCKLTKYGVKYLFKHNDIDLFEVSK